MIEQKPSKLLFAKLGYNKELAKIELSTTLEKLSLTFPPKYFEWKDYLFFSLPENLVGDFFKLIKVTGSIVKAGVCLTTTNLNDDSYISFIKNEVTDIFSYHKNTSYKVKISLDIQSPADKLKSIYGVMVKILNSSAVESKIKIKILPKKPHAVDLSPFQYYKDNVGKRGIEFHFFQIKSKLYVSKTIWVTNPFSDIKLDEGRPQRLFTHGISLKLARSMLNLAKLSKGDYLLDPFSGTGTILIMGLMLGFNVIGAEKDQKCIRASKANIRWAVDKYRITSKWEIYKTSSERINKLLKRKIEAVVTEPYLGPFLKSLPDIAEGKMIMKELEKLYIKVLKASTALLNDNSLVVMIMPIYKYSKDVKLEIDKERIARQCNLISVKSSTFFNVRLPIPIGRSHNIISRELVIFQKLSSADYNF